MTDTQHTDGPWRADIFNSKILVDALHKDATKKVAEVSTVRDEANANARLIAAAPDLYAALEDNIDAIENAFQAAVNHAEGDSDVVGRLNRIKAELRDALAKAEGRDE